MKLQVLNSEQDNHNSIYVGLSGEFDAQGCKEVRQDLEGLVTEHTGQDVALDLADVSFIDSSGIGAIVFLYKRMLENNANLTLVKVQGQPKELITLLRVDKAIPVEWADTSNSPENTP